MQSMQLQVRENEARTKAADEARAKAEEERDLARAPYVVADSASTVARHIGALSGDISTLVQRAQHPAPAPAAPNNELTLEQLAKGLPNTFRRSLQTACSPLSTDTKVPARQDLRMWWRGVEAALLGMGPECEPARLGHVHVTRVAPVLLGPAAWAALADDQFDDWPEFQAGGREAFRPLPRGLPGGLLQHGN